MNSTKKRNIKFNFNLKNNIDYEFVNLFNCSFCGFHEKVISKQWIKGKEEDFIVNLKTINPEGCTISCISENHTLVNDGEIIEELICGICGTNGRIEQVPKHTLKVNGIKISKNKNIGFKINTSNKKHNHDGS